MVCAMLDVCVLFVLFNPCFMVFRLSLLVVRLQWSIHEAIWKGFVCDRLSGRSMFDKHSLANSATFSARIVTRKTVGVLADGGHTGSHLRESERVLTAYAAWRCMMTAKQR